MKFQLQKISKAPHNLHCTTPLVKQFILNRSWTLRQYLKHFKKEISRIRKSSMKAYTLEISWGRACYLNRFFIYKRLYATL